MPPVVLNGVYLSRYSRLKSDPKDDTPSPSLQRLPPLQRDPDTLVLPPAAGCYGSDRAALLSKPRRLDRIPVEEALAASCPLARSQIQIWGSQTDSCLQRHRDWRSNREGVGQTGLFRHRDSHRNRVTSWMEAAQAAGTAQSCAVRPLTRGTLNSMLPSSKVTGAASPLLYKSWGPQHFSKSLGRRLEARRVKL